MTLLARAHVRHLWRERWQALLALLGVAVGVAVVVAVDLVNASSREAMRIATAQLSGAATHVIVGPGERVDEALYAELRLAWRRGDPGLARVEALAPLVIGRGWFGPVAADVLDGGGAAVRILGVDPVTDSSVRDLVGAPGSAGTPGFDGARLLTDPRAVLLDATTARRIGVEVGDEVSLRTSLGARSVSILGLLPAQDASVGEGLLIADIATAQELLGRRGWIDRVDLVMARAASVRPALALLERLFPGLVVQRSDPVVARLPGGLRIEAVADRTEDTRALASSFQLNLAALGLLALVVGLFLIHGALRFSVLRRQRQFGGLRAIGVLPAELARMVMLEALVLGVLGSLVGMLLGRVLAAGLLGLVSATLQGLYDQVAIGALAVDAVPYLKGAAVGIGGSLLVAAPSARAAAAMTPRLLSTGAMDRLESLRGPWLRAAVLTGLGLLALRPGTTYVGGLLAIAMFLLAAAALTPIAVRALIDLLARMSARAPIGTRVYLLESARGLTRSGIASSALLVAIATAVGMGVMVESFRGSVESWLSARLSAPLYVRIGGSSDAGEDAPGHDDTGIPEAARALLDARAGTWLERHSFRDRVEGRPVSITLVDVHGTWPASLEAVMRTGRWDGTGALVSEPLARSLELPIDARPSSASGAGGLGTIELDRGAGAVPVPIAGVFREYGGGRGSITLPKGAWPDAPPGMVTLEIFDVEDVGALRSALERTLPANAEIRLNGEILALSLRIFDRTFRVTAVLQTLAGLVAGIGLFGALSALAIERSAQFGVMRTLGVGRSVPALASVGESLLIALLSALLALPVGVGIAIVLVDVVNVRAFGWSLDLALSPVLFGEAVLIALAAGFLAALAPALRLWREAPARMLAQARVAS